VGYREDAIRHYAQDKIRSGEWAEHEALRLSATDHDALLPLGVDTPDHHLFTVYDADTDERVATIWLTLRPVASRVEGFVYDIEVVEKYRGQGYGRATMLAGIEKARELRADTVGLHVFGHNALAHALYKSLGFVETHINMSLEL
jgi:GNAT superfamily N-acetyltransferase